MQLPEQLQTAIRHYLRGIATEEERQLVNDWYYSFSDDEIEIPIETTGEREQIKEQIIQRVMQAMNKEPAGIQPVVPMYRRKWAVAAAIALTLTVGVGAYYLATRSPVIDENNKVTQTSYNDDIPPGGNRATLTLADGSTMILDEAANGTLAQQGNTQVVKLDDGQLAYTANSTYSYETITVEQYNTISTPRGGQYMVVLPDGSKVWLNAASSLKYPTAFSGSKRIVELTGEGYFEIVKNGKMPFAVKAGETEVEVLGTVFNVNSYADEEEITTTLVEGSVNVKTKWLTKQLKPGEQAGIVQNRDITVKPDVNVAAAVAWKEGYFIFDEVDIKTVMRQVARWYNVDVRYDSELLPETYYGKIKRNTGLSEVLRVLEESGVSFTVEGNLITVQK